jgi:Spy/CpxP family protein refolding chaperone
MKIFATSFFAAALLIGASVVHAQEAPPVDAKPMKGRHDRLMHADGNKDGFLTKEEMIDAQRKKIDKMFERTDTDKDGKLSVEERQKAREEMRKRWESRKSGKASPEGGAADEKTSAPKD